jgi:predicted HTH transcriptional regulator
MNAFFNSLLAEPEVVHHLGAEELIKLPESATLEFKSTLQWDVVRSCANKALRHSILRTIAAFLNSEGGTLIMGVEDNGAVFGLEKDFECVGGQDRFGQTLANLTASEIGTEFGHLLSMRFVQVEGKTVCVVDVRSASQPAFLNGPAGKQFFIRLGNTTRILDAEETVSYTQSRWG